MLGADFERVGSILHAQAGDPAVPVIQADDLAVKAHPSAVARDGLCETLPHHPRAQDGIVELADERLGPVGAEQGLSQRRRQRQRADTLGGPVRADRPAGHTPDLFGVALKEPSVQAHAEAVGHPLFEGLGLSMWPELRLEITQQDQRTLADAEIAEGIDKTERVVEEIPVVMDARQPPDLQQIVPEHFLPEPLHLVVLGVEAMPADVEAAALVDLRAGQPADLVRLFQHERRAACLRQLVRGREAGRTGADDDDGMACYQLCCVPRPSKRRLAVPARASADSTLESGHLFPLTGPRLKRLSPVAYMADQTDPEGQAAVQVVEPMPGDRLHCEP